MPPQPSLPVRLPRNTRSLNTPPTASAGSTTKANRHQQPPPTSQQQPWWSAPPQESEAHLATSSSSADAAVAASAAAPGSAPLTLRPQVATSSRPAWQVADASSSTATNGAGSAPPAQFAAILNARPLPQAGAPVAQPQAPPNFNASATATAGSSVSAVASGESSYASGSNDGDTLPAREESLAKVPTRPAGGGGIIDVCCFRDGRSAAPGDCWPSAGYRKMPPGGPPGGPLPPGAKLDPDVALLELKGLLRYHRIDPQEALLHDVLRWGTRMEAGK